MGDESTSTGKNWRQAYTEAGRNVNGSVDRTAQRVRTPTSYTTRAIPAETVAFSAGAAGTTGVVALANSAITDAIGAELGRDADTSFAWGTGTVLTTEIPWRVDQTDTVQLAAMSNGEFAINYDSGKIRYKKATTGTSDTCTYKVKWMKVDTEIEVEVNNITINNVKVLSTDGTSTNAKYGFAVTDGMAADGSKHGLVVAGYDAVGATAQYLRQMKGDAAANSGYHLSIAGEVVDFNTAAGTDYTPSIGLLAASAAGAVPLTVYPEDLAHASADQGLFTLAVRNDNNTAFAATDGDYIPISTTSNGSVWVRDDQWGQHDSAVGSLKGPLVLVEAKEFDAAAFPNAVTEGDAVRPASSLYGVSYSMIVNKDGSKTVEAIDDSAQVATPLILNVGGEYRATATTYTDGDATILQSDINGYLKVVQANTEYTDDSTGFTVATSKGNAIMAIATTDAVDSGDIGALKMDTLRQLATGLYNASGTRLDILTQDAAFGTASTGLGVFGKYQATPTTYTDGDAAPILLDANGRIVLSSDIEIGAVEIKDGTTENRVEVKAPNAEAFSYGLKTMPARYLATPATITDTYTSPLLLGSKAQLLTNLYDGTNTATLITQDAAFGTASVGLPLFGKYQATPTAYTDGDAAPILLDANGRIVLSSDIEIGSVELKDAAADTRASIIAPDSAAVSYYLATMPARYLATPPSLTDTRTSPLLLGSKNQLLTNLFDGTSSLTLMTGTTKTIPQTIHDGTNYITLGAGTTKTLPCELNDGTTKIVFGTGTTKNVPVGFNDGTTAITFGTGTQKTVPCALSDGTTEVDVIAGTAALKTDLSSVAGTATVTGGVNGLIAIAGNVAHDAVDAGYPLKIGGKAATSKPAAVSAADRVDAYLDEYGRLHTIDEGGSTTLPATHVSPIDGAATYTSSTTITCSGFQFTVDDANCMISYIAYKPTAGSWTILANGANGVSITSSSNLITITGAGTPFASGDSYRIGIRYQDKSYTSATNSMRMSEINPLNTQVIEESLVDTTNVAASQQYYPSSLGMAMMGYKNFSITGKYIDGDATTTTIIVQGTNDEDATNADWIAIQGQVQGLSGTVTGIVGGTAGSTINPGSVCTSLVTAIAQTVVFAWDFDNINYRYIRVGLYPGDATNTAIIKARRSY